MAASTGRGPGRTASVRGLEPKHLTHQVMTDAGSAFVDRPTTVMANVASAYAFALGLMARPVRGALVYFDCSAFAGFSRAARAAGIVVARNVIATISKVAIDKINGSDARIAYTRLEIT